MVKLGSFRFNRVFSLFAISILIVSMFSIYNVSAADIPKEVVVINPAGDSNFIQDFIGPEGLKYPEGTVNKEWVDSVISRVEVDPRIEDLPIERTYGSIDNYRTEMINRIFGPIKDGKLNAAQAQIFDYLNDPSSPNYINKIVLNDRGVNNGGLKNEIWLDLTSTGSTTTGGRTPDKIFLHEASHALDIGSGHEMRTANSNAATAFNEYRANIWQENFDLGSARQITKATYGPQWTAMESFFPDIASGKWSDEQVYLATKKAAETFGNERFEDIMNNPELRAAKQNIAAQVASEVDSVHYGVEPSGVSAVSKTKELVVISPKSSSATSFSEVEEMVDELKRNTQVLVSEVEGGVANLPSGKYDAAVNGLTPAQLNQRQTAISELDAVFGKFVEDARAGTLTDGEFKVLKTMIDNSRSGKLNIEYSVRLGESEFQPKSGFFSDKYAIRFSKNDWLMDSNKILIHEGHHFVQDLEEQSSMNFIQKLISNYKRSNDPFLIIAKEIEANIVANKGDLQKAWDVTYKAYGPSRNVKAGVDVALNPFSQIDGLFGSKLNEISAKQKIEFLIGYKQLSLKNGKYRLLDYDEMVAIAKKVITSDGAEADKLAKLLSGVEPRAVPVSLPESLPVSSVDTNNKVHITVEPEGVKVEGITAKEIPLVDVKPEEIVRVSESDSFVGAGKGSVYVDPNGKAWEQIERSFVGSDGVNYDEVIRLEQAIGSDGAYYAEGTRTVSSNGVVQLEETVVRAQGDFLVVPKRIHQTLSGVEITPLSRGAKILSGFKGNLIIPLLVSLGVAAFAANEVNAQGGTASEVLGAASEAGVDTGERFVPVMGEIKSAQEAEGTEEAVAEVVVGGLGSASLVVDVLAVFGFVSYSTAGLAAIPGLAGGVGLIIGNEVVSPMIENSYENANDEANREGVKMARGEYIKQQVNLYERGELSLSELMNDFFEKKVVTPELASSIELRMQNAENAAAEIRSNLNQLNNLNDADRELFEENRDLVSYYMTTKGQDVVSSLNDLKTKGRNTLIEEIKTEVGVQVYNEQVAWLGNPVDYLARKNYREQGMAAKFDRLNGLAKKSPVNDAWNNLQVQEKLNDPFSQPNLVEAGVPEFIPDELAKVEETNDLPETETIDYNVQKENTPCPQGEYFDTENDMCRPGVAALPNGGCPTGLVPFEGGCASCEDAGMETIVDANGAQSCRVKVICTPAQIKASDNNCYSCSAYPKEYSLIGGVCTKKESTSTNSGSSGSSGSSGGSGEPLFGRSGLSGRPGSSASSGSSGSSGSKKYNCDFGGSNSWDLDLSKGAISGSNLGDTCGNALVSHAKATCAQRHGASKITCSTSKLSMTKDEKDYLACKVRVKCTYTK